MNQDIIEYLEGYWVKWRVKCNDYCYYYSFKSSSGEMVFYPLTNVLTLKADYQDEGYEVQIQDLTHLIQLEALL